MEPNNPNDNSENNPNDTPPTPPSDESNLPNETHDGDGSNNGNTENPKKGYRSWGVADQIALWGLIVNFIIAVATIAVFWLSRESTRAATRATEIADSTFKLSVKSSKESDSINRVRFKMDSATNQAQIAAMNEQIKILKDQFEIENTPYLRVEVEKLEIEIGKPLNINYFTLNLGKHPVKVNSTKIRVIALDKNIRPNREDMFKDMREQSVNFYITNQFPHGTNFLPELTVDKLIYDKLDSGEWFLYLVGEETYTNLINKKLIKFRFLIRFDVIKQPIGITVLENENIPLN